MHDAKVGSFESSQQNSDRELLHDYRRGKEDAATALYLRYAARLQAWAASRTSPALSSRFDPEDVIQSVFRTFFRRASKGMYDVPPGEELWQLLLVIALNKVRKLATFHRAQKRSVDHTENVEFFSDDQARSRDDRSLRILELVIDEILADRTPAQREIVKLRIDGYRIDEIAEKTERSRRTVERILRDFRIRLGEAAELNVTD